VNPALADLLLTKGARLVLIVFIAWALAWLIRRLAPRLIRGYLMRVRAFGPAMGTPGESPDEQSKRAATLSGVLIWTAEIGLAAYAILAILNEFNIDTGPALASLGVLGIAVGFGAQALVKDCITGVFILLENQYRKGDVVKIAGISGLVEDISLRRTLLRDLDGTVHHVPNGEIRTASNLTREWSRVNLNIPVAHGSDVDTAASILTQVGQTLAADPAFAEMITEPPHFVRVESFTEAGVHLKVLGVTKPMRQWDVMGEYRRRVLYAFAQAGIKMPQLPQPVAPPPSPAVIKEPA
jgi:small conductance mechanosensitive channel